MYEQFYALKEKPFNLLADPAFLYLSKKHELALNYLEYGLSEQAGFIVITGEVGSGKTTLIKYLLTKLDRTQTKTALIFNTNITPREFLELVLREWDITSEGKEKADYYNALYNFLLHKYTRRNQVVLIIDEAQNLSLETLEEIRMLSNLNDEKHPLLHIILLGQPNLRERLNQKTLEQLRQRIAVHYHLEPLDHADTVRYIKHRLQKAGGENQELFMPDAIDSIYQHSQGIPRVVNVICDTALVYGFAEGAEQITKSIIESVIEERTSGGLSFLEDSESAGGKNFSAEGNGATRELEEIKKQYTVLNTHISELTMLVKKLYSEKESGKNVIGNAVNKPRKLSGAGEKKKRQTAHKRLDKERNMLFDRIKSLEKKFQRNTISSRRVISRFLTKNISRYGVNRNSQG
jgi:general secretion pathway protein A